MTGLEISRHFAESIEKERDRLGLSQSEMASKLEVSLSTYKRLVNQTTEKVNLNTISKLYMLTGRLIYEQMGVSDAYIDIRAKLADLTSSQMMYIESLIEFEREFSLQSSDVDDYVSVYVPTGNMEDGMIYDSANVEKVRIAEYRAIYGDSINCGIRITSNHLHPVYNRDDVLLISRRPIRDGDTGIFINKENRCAYIRRFRQTSPCALEPLNDYGETIWVNSNDKQAMDKWIKFGVVIAKVR